MKRVNAWQFEQELTVVKFSKTAMGKKMHASRAEMAQERYLFIRRNCQLERHAAN